MVSTRGVKLKFLEGERVLCYEPDPTKAKVLYDSKVLDIIVKKDSRGKKFVEYMIHFQGWNSSWDRSVSEEYVLKDTPENRQLQRDLAEKSELHIGAYLYRKERKKHNRNSIKVNERAGQSSEDGSCGSLALMEEEDGHGHTSTSEEESSGEEEIVPIELPPFIKQFLEQDFYNIKTKNKLHKLPCDRHVIHILEDYWKHYAMKILTSTNEKPSARQRHSYNNHQNTQKRKPEDIQRKLNLGKEILDGIRTYFDFLLNDVLLYNPEKGQFVTIPTRAAPTLPMKFESQMKNEPEDQEYAHLPVVEDDETFHNDMDTSTTGRLTRRRTLRSNKSCDSTTNGTTHSEPTNSHKVKNNVHHNNHSEVNGVGLKIPVWKAVPDCAYTQQPPPPCLIYGAPHLVRLFVKLPDMLGPSTVSEERMKIITEGCEQFLEYLGEHKEWFTDIHYVDV